MFGKRSLNETCKLVVMRVVADTPGALKRTVNIVITPFHEDLGGRAQITDRDNGSIILITTLLGATLGAG